MNKLPEPSDPGDMSFGREIATIAEIEAMAAMAKLFVEDIEPTIQRSYSYQTDTGISLILHSVVHESEDQELETAAIIMDSDDHKTPLFRLTLDGNNDNVYDRLGQAGRGGGLAVAFKELIEKTNPTQTETKLFEFIINNTGGLKQPDQDLDQEIPDERLEIDLSGNVVPLADLVRQLVEAKATIVLRVKEFSPPLDDSPSPHVTYNQLVSVADTETVEDLPMFWFEITDPDNGDEYTYTQDFGGGRSLTTPPTAEAIPRDQTELRDMDDFDERDLAAALDYYTPKRADVETVTRLLRQAWQKQNLPSGPSLN